MLTREKLLGEGRDDVITVDITDIDKDIMVDSVSNDNTKPVIQNKTKTYRQNRLPNLRNNNTKVVIKNALVNRLGGYYVKDNISGMYKYYKPDNTFGGKQYSEKKILEMLKNRELVKKDITR